MAEKLAPLSSSPGATGLPEEKPRLTDEEKKQNHIASEQKRRQAIRDGFDRLCVLVPGLEGQGRSEGLVLKRTVEFIREQLQKRRYIILEKEARGEVVEDRYKEPVRILEHLEKLDKERGRGTTETTAKGSLEEDEDEA